MRFQTGTSMRTARKQTTIARPFSLSGRGYWSGEANTLTFLPADADSGIRFRRVDLPGRPSVQALAENRQSMSLRTCLHDGLAQVAMVEHVLSALTGMQVDNCTIECTATEIPGFDGSSHALTVAIEEAGVEALEVVRQTLIIRREISIVGDRQWIKALPCPAGEYEVEYLLDYGVDSPIGISDYRTPVRPDLYAAQLAPARTFVTEAEAAEIQRRGMASHVTDQDLLVFGQDGPRNNRLRFPDECARHKALDMVGDLALAGVDLVGRFTASRSGHLLNGEMAQTLRELALKEKPIRQQDAA